MEGALDFPLKKKQIKAYYFLPKRFIFLRKEFYFRSDESLFSSESIFLFSRIDLLRRKVVYLRNNFKSIKFYVIYCRQGRYGWVNV